MSGLVYKPEYDKGSQAREVQNAFDKKIQASRQEQASLQKLGLDIATSRYMAAAKAKQEIYGGELGNMSDAQREDITKLRNQIREKYNNGDFARNPYMYGTMLKGLNDQIARSSQLHKDAISGDGENTYNSQMDLINKGEYHDFYDKKGYDVVSADPAAEQQDNYNKYNNNAFYSNTRFDENGVIVAEQTNPETGEVMGTKDVASMPLWELGSNLFQPDLKVLSPLSLYDLGGSQEVQTRLTQIESGLRNNVGSVNYTEGYGEDPQSIEVAMMTPLQKQNYISDTYFDDMTMSSVHKDTSGARSFRRSLAHEMGIDASTPEFQLFVEGRYDELSETSLGENLMRNARNKWREVTRMLPASKVANTTNKTVAGDSRTMVLGALQDPSNPEQIENALNVQAGVLPYGNMTGYSFVNKDNQPDPIEFEGSAFDGGEYNVSALFYEVDESSYVEGSDQIPGRLMARVVIPEKEVVEYQYIDSEGNAQFTENEDEARNKSEGPYEGKSRTRKIESTVKLVPLDEGIGSQGEEILNRVRFGTDPDVFNAQMEQLRMQNTMKFWEARAAQEEALAAKERMNAVDRLNAAIPMANQAETLREIEDIQRRMTAYRPATQARYNRDGVLVEEGRPASDRLEDLQQRLNELKTSEFVSQDADGNNVYTPVSKLMADRKTQEGRNKDRVEAAKVAWKETPMGRILLQSAPDGASFFGFNDEEMRGIVDRLEKVGTIRIPAEEFKWAMENMPTVAREIRNHVRTSSGGIRESLERGSGRREDFSKRMEESIYEKINSLAPAIRTAYRNLNNPSTAPSEEEDDGLTFPVSDDVRTEPAPTLPPEVEDTRRASNEALGNLPDAIKDQVTARIEEIRGRTGQEVRIVVEPNSAGDANLVTFVDAMGEELSEDPIIFDI